MAIPHRMTTVVQEIRVGRDWRYKRWFAGEAVNTALYMFNHISE